MKFDASGDLEFQLSTMLNEGLELGDNFRGALLEIETTGEEQEVQHNLGFTPNGFIILLIDGDANVWATRLNDWNNQSLFLVSSAASLTVRLFVT